MFLAALLLLVPSQTTVDQATTVDAAASTWPGFLGAGATDVDPTSIPTQWSPEQNIAWEAKIVGHGQSSPVVYGNRVFVTSCDGPNKEKLHVACMRLSDGKVLWDKAVTSSNPEKNSLYISRAAPTPVVDGEHVFAYFESGDVVAYTHDGDRAWQISLTKQYGKPLNRFGLSASPVQTAEHLVILIDDEKPQGRVPGRGTENGPENDAEAHSYLVALRKTDGSTAWKQDRENRTSWSSPAIVPVNGEPVIVCSSSGSVDGFAPEDGTLLFQFTDVGGNTSSTPMPVGDGRFLVGASPGRGEEGDRAEKARQSNGLMQVTHDNGQWSAKFLWRNTKVTPSFGSPMVHQGYAYWVNRAGAVYCLDVETGELAYSGRLESCWATPLGIGDRVYFFSQKKGTTNVIASGPKFEKLATNRLWEQEPPDDSLKSAAPESGQRAAAAGMFSGQTTYGAAAVSGSLLIRTGNRLFCIRQQ